MNDELRDSLAERLRTGESWNDFCDTLRAAGQIVLRESESTIDRTEGFRYLTRLLRSSLERFVENSESYRPRVLDTPFRVSIAIQSPDQDHPLIEIDGQYDYRISGTRNTVSYASFLALAGRLPPNAGAEALGPRAEAALEAFDPTAFRATGFLSVHDLAIDDDGRFEIILSQREHPGNWLRLEPDSSFVMIRQTFLDRRTEKGMDLSVERLPPEPARPIEPHELARALAVASQNVVGTAVRFLHWATQLAEHPDTLRSIGADYGSSGGSPDHLMYFGYWEIEGDDVLEITARLPDNDYWNFQACSWWLENFDNYEDGKGYITKRTAVVEPDGSVILRLAHGVPDGPERDRGNWIDLFGHTRGTMNLRIVHPEGEADIRVEKRKHYGLTTTG